MARPAGRERLVGTLGWLNSQVGFSGMAPTPPGQTSQEDRSRSHELCSICCRTAHASLKEPEKRKAMTKKVILTQTSILELSKYLPMMPPP